MLRDISQTDRITDSHELCDFVRRQQEAIESPVSFNPLVGAVRLKCGHAINRVDSDEIEEQARKLSQPAACPVCAAALEVQGACHEMRRAAALFEAFFPDGFEPDKNRTAENAVNDMRQYKLVARLRPPPRSYVGISSHVPGPEGERPSGPGAVLAAPTVAVAAAPRALPLPIAIQSPSLLYRPFPNAPPASNATASTSMGPRPILLPRPTPVPRPILLQLPPPPPRPIPIQRPISIQRPIPIQQPIPMPRPIPMQRPIPFSVPPFLMPLPPSPARCTLSPPAGVSWAARVSATASTPSGVAAQAQVPQTPVPTSHRLRDTASEELAICMEPMLARRDILSLREPYTRLMHFTSQLPLPEAVGILQTCRALVEQLTRQKYGDAGRGAHALLDTADISATLRDARLQTVLILRALAPTSRVWEHDTPQAALIRRLDWITRSPNSSLAPHNA